MTDHHDTTPTTEPATEPTGIAALVAEVPHISSDWQARLVERAEDCLISVEQLNRFDSALRVIADNPARWRQEAWLTFIDGAWPHDKDPDRDALTIDDIDPEVAASWSCTSAMCLAGHVVAAEHGERLRPVFDTATPSHWEAGLAPDRTVFFANAYQVRGRDERRIGFDVGAALLLGFITGRPGNNPDDEDSYTIVIENWPVLFAPDNSFETLLRFRNRIASGADWLDRSNRF